MILCKQRNSSRVAVHASEEVVDSEIGGEDAEEGEYHIEMIEMRIAELGHGLSMEGNSINHEGDESPRFLRVPRPVGAPRDVCPDGTKEDACGEKENGGIK